jgi:hypothetical protein
MIALWHACGLLIKGEHYFEEPVISHHELVNFYDLNALDRIAKTPIADESYPDPMPELYADRFMGTTSRIAKLLRVTGALNPELMPWGGGHCHWLYTKADLLKARECLQNSERLHKKGSANPMTDGIGGHFWVIQITSPVGSKKTTCSIVDLAAAEFVKRGIAYTRRGAMKKHKIPGGPLKLAIIRGQPKAAVRRSPYERRWTAEEEARLGKMKDKDLAAIINRKESAVRQRRGQLGISPFKSGPQTEPELPSYRSKIASIRIHGWGPGGRVILFQTDLALFVSERKPTEGVETNTYKLFNEACADLGITRHGFNELSQCLDKWVEMGLVTPQEVVHEQTNKHIRRLTRYHIDELRTRWTADLAPLAEELRNVLARGVTAKADVDALFEQRGIVGIRFGRVRRMAGVVGRSRTYVRESQVPTPPRKLFPKDTAVNWLEKLLTDRALPFAKIMDKAKKKIFNKKHLNLKRLNLGYVFAAFRKLKCQRLRTRVGSIWGLKDAKMPDKDEAKRIILKYRADHPKDRKTTARSAAATPEPTVAAPPSETKQPPSQVMDSNAPWNGKCPVNPVGIREGKYVFRVNGKEKRLLMSQADVILALIDAGPSGLDKDDLEIKGRPGARRMLRNLKETDTDWRAVIKFPSDDGKPRYRIG